MDELNRHSAFANRRCDTFHGTRTHVACSKDAGMAGLQQKRRAAIPQCVDCATAAPVRTNPFASRSISGGSQSVSGVRR